MCLTDNNFKNLPTGDVVDKLLREWGLEEINGKIDGHGFYKTSLFHGDYQVKVSHPTLNNSFLSQSLSVASQVDDESHHTTLFPPIKSRTQDLADLKGSAHGFVDAMGIRDSQRH
ncbi:hypothetical protein FEM48_Zijuj09G0136400 [Ziziphus jujuba var. spinosa]|uniref:Uncharacterized protein n=1 Tax=Ziziphus jujuba var. spinosa TaxID=714518 RepID=A0A978UTB6_ZIZJJ|nr:hypothetical protein FEM48_Zijuj09G0136400 [Ziziphus jujuba var. spinosa]